MSSIINKILRVLCRYTIRQILKFSPKFIKDKISWIICYRMQMSRIYLIVNRIFRGEEIIKWRGITIKIDPGDTIGIRLYLLNDYSGDEIEKLIELSTEANILADVGASIGFIALPLARSCPQLEIFGFEPDGDMARKFYANLELNKDLSKRVHLVEKACAEVDGNLLFEASRDPINRYVGRLVYKKTQRASTYYVPSLRLDTFFESIGKYPDIVKIDVEGGELRVLQGMRGLLNKFKKV